MFNLIYQLLALVKKSNTLVAQALASRGLHGDDMEEFNFPMSTMADVDNVQALLQDGNKRKKLVIKLKEVLIKV